MSIEHQSFIKNGIEDYESDKVKEWKGAQENYTLENVGEKTQLLIQTDIAESYLEEFGKAWGKGLYHFSC
ncbi:hypothetical protein UMM65_07100 [Aureibaculum sp. 2210JD6-5]|uniref:hypothetical protein n=1 Tax=Aureibaculum sp. 2210JD6-5 TaxID=3103957 RepID=UPI002AAEC9C3|nr:hypothetical protein [Aureibaculum sp. 2210JD6-5]MDY7395003.1 hypothetical protein [Aureibaculum sp. 2210JD6-5]